MTELTTYLLALALQFAPPERATQLPGWEETVAERTARYAQIAETVASVALDPKQKPIAGMSRKASAVLLLAVAIGESNLDPDADKGPCYRRGKLKARCDYGHAASIWQIMIGNGYTPYTMWTQHDLFRDRKKAALTAYRAIRGSFATCRANSLEHRLAAYGSGNCQGAHKGSAKRIGLWRKMIAYKVKKNEKAPESDRRLSRAD